jgi:hypothetical protein
LNKMVKDGRSPEYVRDHAEEKTFSARQKDDDDEE